jgi:hypothetical protein
MRAMATATVGHQILDFCRRLVDVARRRGFRNRGCCGLRLLGKVHGIHSVAFLPELLDQLKRVFKLLGIRGGSSPILGRDLLL